MLIFLTVVSVCSNHCAVSMYIKKILLYTNIYSLKTHERSHMILSFFLPKLPPKAWGMVHGNLEGEVCSIICTHPFAPTPLVLAPLYVECIEGERNCLIASMVEAWLILPVSDTVPPRPIGWWFICRWIGGPVGFPGVGDSFGLITSGPFSLPWGPPLGWKPLLIPKPISYQKDTWFKPHCFSHPIYRKHTLDCPCCLNVCVLPKFIFCNLTLKVTPLGRWGSLGGD